MASFDVPKRLHAAQHATGQPDAITPASIGAAPASRFLTGTGSPEGVTAAPVGTTYKDTTNGNEWHKMTGTGVTGWRGPIVFGDDPRLSTTAWADVDWLPTENLAATAQKARTRNGNVEFEATFTTTSTTAANRLTVIPVGMRPATPVATTLHFPILRVGAHLGSIAVASSGTIGSYPNAVVGATLYLRATWPTA